MVRRGPAQMSHAISVGSDSDRRASSQCPRPGAQAIRRAVRAVAGEDPAPLLRRDGGDHLVGTAGATVRGEDVAAQAGGQYVENIAFLEPDP
ncbi:hypothetical protein Rwratislav_31514 [Rhodococcus wratislaviensis IFP 2016]|nr:hypothetical protein Rwratislav_31514 [Rhodococcus wratislaviensis IFP 2016]